LSFICRNVTTNLWGWYFFDWSTSGRGTVFIETAQMQLGDYGLWR
jgi:hypothetical protein